MAWSCQNLLKKVSWFFATFISLTAAAAATAIENPLFLASTSTQLVAAPSAIHIKRVKSGPHQVVVAVIDSGIIADHPALQGRLLPGYDMQSWPQNTRGDRSNDFKPDPPNQGCQDVPVSNTYRTHGTEVASLIVGNGYDNVWGVNPGALVLPIRITGPCPMTRRDIIDALAWAAGFEVSGVPLNPFPAQVINLSFSGGGFRCDLRTQALIDLLVMRGIFVVAARNNSLDKPLQEPANCRGVVSVSAVNGEGHFEVYSRIDSKNTSDTLKESHSLKMTNESSVNTLRVATEIIDLLGRPQLVGAHRQVGTSHAAPVVSGFIALLLSYQPNARPSDLFQILESFNEQIPFFDSQEWPYPGMFLRYPQEGTLIQ